MFAFVLYDKILDKTYVARDPYGVRPLFIGITNNDEICICSEIKPISKFCKNITPFQIGSYLDLQTNTNDFDFKQYHNYNFKFNNDDEITIKSNIRNYLLKPLIKD